jgi:RNA polymerase sigma-70 factor (ECF subfamily)
MTMRRQLSREFLAHSPPEAARELSAAPDLDRLLRRLCDTGRAAWPEIELGDLEFAQHVASRLPQTEALEALRRLHAGDLYIACACSLTDKRAIAAFDKRFSPEIALALASMNLTGTVAEEVKQLLRERLFVTKNSAPAKIGDYSGRGPLGRWIRVAAVRTALSLMRRQHKEVPPEEVEIRAPAPDPELQYIKKHYQAEFRAAFQTALSALEPQERTVLRQHFIEGRSIDEIGAAFQVHRATAARWIVKARERLLAATRKGLAQRLKLKPSQLQSVMGLVRSQIDLSISQFLK